MPAKWDKEKQQYTIPIQEFKKFKFIINSFMVKFFLIGLGIGYIIWGIK